jgi:hypothetical protein
MVYLLCYSIYIVFVKLTIDVRGPVLLMTNMIRPRLCYQ